MTYIKLFKSKVQGASSSSGKMGLERRIYAGFSPSCFLPDVNLMLKIEGVYFHYSKPGNVEQGKE